MSPDADELDLILRYRLLQPLFQPVYDAANRCVFGYEALVRGPLDSPLHLPNALLPAAARCGRLFELDLVCRELAIRRFQQLGLPGRLFLNVNPLSLVEPTFRPGETLRLLQEVRLSPQRVVIELTEQQVLSDYATLKTAVRHYLAEGFHIAIDDLGAGYAGLRLWSELKPSYVKLDQHFVRGIGGDEVKREFVRFILNIAAYLDCTVVAEGIETRDEYDTLRGLKVPLHQGYYLARPAAEPARDYPLMTRFVPAHGQARLRSLPPASVAETHSDLPA